MMSDMEVRPIPVVCSLPQHILLNAVAAWGMEE